MRQRTALRAFVFPRSLDERHASFNGQVSRERSSVKQWWGRRAAEVNRAMARSPNDIAPCDRRGRM